MPVMRQAVGERWAVVEHVFRCAVAMRDAGAERVVGSPVVEDVEFERREFRRSGCGLRVGGHCGALSPVPYVAGFAAPEALGRWLRSSGSRMSGTGTTSRRCASAAVPPRLRTVVCAAQMRAMTGPPVRVYWAGSAVLPKASPVMAGSVPLHMILVPAAKAPR